MRQIFAATLALTALTAASTAQARPLLSPLGERFDSDNELNPAAEPPMLGIHWTRDFLAKHSLSLGGGGLGLRNPNMTFHNGRIMPKVVSKAIFWGPSWANASFASDKISGLDQWYAAHNGSHYAATVNEYSGSNGAVGSTGFTHQGHIVDTSAAAGGGSTAAILAEVCKQVSAGAIVPDAAGNGYYPVYTDVKRGSAGYCAWHSYGSCSGVPVQIAYFFNLDGDASCDPKDTSGAHSQGLAALANVTAHEIAEARSDPSSPGAWYDSSGNENGDKCAWTFNVAQVSFPDGSKWKLQGEWSNAAYNNGTGYANSSNQKGCVSGK